MANPDPLNAALAERRLNRRALAKKLAAPGLAGAASSVAVHGSAQSATPAATQTSTIDRAAYQAALRSHFDLETDGASGGQLIYVQTNDLVTLNPTLVNDIYSSIIVGSMYESLVTTSAIDGTPVPGLADAWEIASDGVTYTFHLNPSATWHDGMPVIATDVAFTFDAVLDTTSLSPRRSAIEGILASHRALDDTTIEFVAVDRIATFVADIGSQFGILPSHIWSSIPPAEWGSAPASTGEDPARVIGSGPFRFREWFLGDHATVVRNDQYWDSAALPMIQEFSYRIVPDSTSAIQTLRVGEVDIADVPFTQVGPLVEESRGLAIHEFDTFDFTYYHFNQTEDMDLPFRELDIRRAMIHALDRDLIADVVYQGLATAAIGSQPTLSIAYDPSRITSHFEFDPDRSRELLAAAGFEDRDTDGVLERDGRKLSFEMAYPENVLVYSQLIPYMQQAWREIGVEMIPVRMSFGALIDAMLGGSYQAAIALLSWDTTGNQGALFRCDSVPPAGFNTMHYCNPEYDDLDDQQLRELDPSIRRELLIALANIVNDDQAISVLVFNKSVQASLQRVHNFRPIGYSAWWSLPYISVDAS